MNTIVKALVLDRQDNILVLKRSDTHPHYAQQADIPGGEVEPAEDLVSALIREIREETGLRAKRKIIKLLNERIVNGNVCHQVYECRVREIKPRIAVSWEHQSYEWVPINEASDALTTDDGYMVVVYEWLATNAGRNNTKGG